MNLGRKIQDAALEWVWRAVSRHPWQIIVSGVVLALVCAVASSLFLRLNADQDSLVSKDLPYQKRYLEHIENFGDQEYLFVVIRTGGTEEGKRRAAAFSDQVAASLAGRPDLIQAVYHRLKPRDMGPGALLFASLDESRELAATVSSAAPLVNRYLAEPSLARLFDTAAQALSSPDQSAGLAGSGPALFGTALDGLDSLLARMRERLAAPTPPAPEPGFGLEELGAQHFFTANGKLLVMRILPAKDFGTMDVVGEPLKLVRQAMAEARAAIPGVDAGLTGRPVLAADEMSTTDADMTLAGAVSAGLMALLFVFVLRDWLRPLLIMATLGLAEAWTFGFALVTLGELNLLSIVFALVMAGLGVGYGIHVVLRHAQATSRGLPPEAATRETVFTQGAGVFLNAGTTMSAFLTVLGSDFVGLAHLGLVAGAGILFCLVAQLFVLPALLLVLGRKGWLKPVRAQLTALPALEGVTDRAKALLFILAASAVALAPWALKVGFNYNVLELQARGLESVAYEKALLEESDESTWFAMSSARDLEGLRALKERFAAQPGVGRIESILDFLPPDQEAKAALNAQARALLDPVPAPEAVPARVDAGELSRSMDRLAEGLESLEEKLFAAGAKEEIGRVEGALKALADLSGSLARDPALAQRLSGLQLGLGREIAGLLGWFREALAAREVHPASLPPALKDLYMGKDGAFQLKVSPLGDVWDMDNLAAFVAAIRAVDPQVCGVPVGFLESAHLMHRTFLSAGVWTLALVSLLFIIYSRSVEYVVLALLPLGFGLVWLLEGMGLSGLHFNLANFFAIPMLIGVGVDGGVHLLARRKELGSAHGLFRTSSPMAVALSVATTIIGFCGLLAAHHRGLASLGAVMVLGSVTCMVGCLLVLPASMKLLSALRFKRGSR